MTNIWEYEDLARYLCDVDLDDDTDIEEILYERFQMEFSEFARMTDKLLNLITVAESPLSKKVYKGFSDGQGLWLVKKEVDNEA